MAEQGARQFARAPRGVDRRDDRLAGFEAEMLNVQVEFPIFQRLALPITVGHTRMPGIKIHDTRMMRLLEVLLHAGSQLAGSRTATIHAAVLAAFGLTADQYSITKLRYDLRKLKAHGLLERVDRTYAYRLTDKGIQVGTLFILFHKPSAALWRTHSFSAGQRIAPHGRRRSRRSSSR